MAASIREINDVPYSTADTGIDPLKTLDLYVPEALFNPRTRSKSRVVLLVFVHGGAWRTGDKSKHVGTARRWAAPSPSLSTSRPEEDEDGTFIIVAVPNYRLSPAVKHPVHTDDIYAALQFLLARPYLPGGGPQISLEYSSVWIAGHSAGAHIAASLVLDAPNLTTFPASERDPSVLGRITGVVGIEGIYDIDLLLKSFPSDFYRGFVEQAFGTRSQADSGTEIRVERLPYGDVNAAEYILPPSGTAGSLNWTIIHSREDDLVDLVQAECMYSHLCHLYGEEEHSERMGPGTRVVLEDKRVCGGHDEVLESEELTAFVHETVLR